LFHQRFGRFLGAAVVLLFAAPAAAATPPQPCKAGQAELKPLEALTLVTSRGAYAFKVEDARTYRQREIGLMCRRSVAADRGMLFDFGQPTDGVAFWMHNTLAPLDIVFIRPDGVVLSIARNAQPLDDTPLPAGGVIRGVLEIAGGRAAQIGLLPGDQVRHRIFAK
jgi:uncharacterized membrane protein (UPF0127 family)